MLELARDAITQAEHDPAQPIPVIFPLASWARRRAPLSEWLADELSSQYQIPKQVGARWIKNHLILPLLDGLDEVRDEAQPECVAAINTFHEQHGLSGLVVTCRSDEYAGQRARLKLNSAIVIQPLGPEQVEEWLRRGGSRLKGLRAALAEDPELREMSAAPLMLNVMSLAFANQPTSSVVNTQSQESSRDRLFDLYVQRMLSRGQSPADLRLAGWLQRLARAMLEQHQSIFLIEQLQPSWLPAGTARWAYVLGTWLLLGLFIAGALGLLIISQVSLDGIVRGALGAASGLLCSMVAAVLNLWLLRRAERSSISEQRTAPLAALSAVILGVLILLTHWIAEGIVAWALGMPNAWLSGVAIGLIRGPTGGLIFGLLLHWLWRRRWADSIQPVEALGWKWQPAFQGALTGGRNGAVVGIGLAFALMVVVTMTTLTQPDFAPFLADYYAAGLAVEDIIILILAVVVIFLCGVGMVFVLVVGGIGAIIGGLIGGLRGRSVSQRTQPNQGIRQSARNALLAGALFGVIGSLLFTLTLTSYEAATDRAWLQPDYLLYYGAIALTSGWAFGLIGALRYGGLAVIQHLTLRVLLAASGQLPLNLIATLNEACDRTLLQMVGGGYIFIHRALLEYFASRALLYSAQSPILPTQNL
ncbi:MAG: NACHT domain-containing protein [Anaerolineales bacterium]